MSKELLTIERLFSWQEVINFSEENYHFNYKILERLFLKKSQIDSIASNIESYLDRKFLEAFPDFPFRKSYFDYHFVIRSDENGIKRVFIDMNALFQQIIQQTTDQNIDNRYMKTIFSVPDEELKGNVVDQLQKNKDHVNSNLSSDYSCGYNVSSNQVLSKNEYREALLSKRKMANWVIRHYDQLYEFLNQPISLDIFANINKDKFLLSLVSYSLNQANILNSGNIIVDLNCLNNIHEYSLLIDYLNEENQLPYSCNFHSYLADGSDFLITSDTIIKEFKRFCNNYYEKIKDYPFARSYEEVLKKKALATWKRIQSERHAKNIRLNFEMIQSGKKITLANYQKGNYKKITSTKEERQLKLKQAYDLLEEKMEYFAGTNFQMELIGIDTFAGYTAYIYANGVVVLEKLYKRITKDKENKDVIVPATEEAIYVMNYTEFAELSKYSKPELIQEISLFQNPNVARILHTQNGSWKDKVTKWITGNGYGEFDYEIFDQLIGNLKEENKTLRK